MALWIKKDPNTWVAAKKIWIKKNATEWVLAKKIWVKKNANAWAIFWPKEGPQPEERVEISSDSPEFPATLTGKNYHWEPGNVFTYKFQSSKIEDEDDVNWTDLGTYQTITNPAEGSFNTKTYELLEEDFELEQGSTWFRFVVKGVDTLTSQETVDVSLPLEITVPDAAMTYVSEATTDTIIAITYSDNGNLVYYKKEIYGPSGLISSTIVDPPVNPISFTGLTPNTSYDVVVYPYNFVDVFGTALTVGGISTPNTTPLNTTPPTISPTSGA